MKRALLTAALVGMVGLLGACEISHNQVTGTVTGSGDLATESRPVHGFTAVSVSGAGSLTIEQTGAESLEITAEDNLLPHIRGEVVGDQLLLGFVPGVSVHGTRPVRYRLTVRDLTGIEASGASRVEVVRLDTPSLATALSGASSLSARGGADTHLMALSGASRAELPDLSSRVARATISGASSALLRVSHSLEATVSGGSILEYYGDPVLAADVTGGSSVRRVGP